MKKKPGSEPVLCSLSRVCHACGLHVHYCECPGNSQFKYNRGFWKE